MNEIIDAPDTDKLLAQSRAPDVVDAPTDAIVVKTRLPIRERISALLDFEGRNDPQSVAMAQKVSQEIELSLMGLTLQPDGLYILSQIYANLRKENTPTALRMMRFIEEYVSQNYPGRLTNFQYLSVPEGGQFPTKTPDNGGGSNPTFRTSDGRVLSPKEAVDHMTSLLKQ